MNTKELGDKLSRVQMPNLEGYVAFIYWSLFVTGEDPRYAKPERLEELWARWNIEASDAVRALVEKYEQDLVEKEKYQQLAQQLAQQQQRAQILGIQPQSIYGQVWPADAFKNAALAQTPPQTAKYAAQESWIDYIKRHFP